MVTLLFGLLAGMPLASAPAAARQDDKLKIVFSVPGLNFPFFVHMVNIAKEKADELDIELIVQDGQNDSATQSANLEAAITQGVDGVVISPKDVQALAPGDSGGRRCRHSGRDHRPHRGGRRHPGPRRRRQRPRR